MQGSKRHIAACSRFLRSSSLARLRHQNFPTYSFITEIYWRDDWPKIADGSDWDGKHLLDLVWSGESPFGWDVNVLIEEVEANLHRKVVNISHVTYGSNNYVRQIVILVVTPR